MRRFAMVMISLGMMLGSSQVEMSAQSRRGGERGGRQHTEQRSVSTNQQGRGNGRGTHSAPKHDSKPSAIHQSHGSHQSHNQGMRPGRRPMAPQPQHRPGHAPGHAVAPHPQHHHHHSMRPFVRPVPPVGWVNTIRVPLWRNLFGLTFGTSLNVSLNTLAHCGYNISGYTCDAVYLTGVNQLGYYWPDATIYYSGGAMRGSRFFYSSNFNDISRYNSVYARLVGEYGAPVSVVNEGGGLTASWWGFDNQYVTLQFVRDYTSMGYRYFTILTYGA